MSFRVGVKLSSNETSSHRTVLIMKPSTGSFNFMHNSQIWYKTASILTRNAFHLQCYSVDIFFRSDMKRHVTRSRIEQTNRNLFYLRHSVLHLNTWAKSTNISTLFLSVELTIFQMWCFRKSRRTKTIGYNSLFRTEVSLVSQWEVILAGN